MTYRCISTLTGNFPFALGAATFGDVVYEDRLLNVSSDKPVSGFFFVTMFFIADFDINYAAILFSTTG